MVFPAVVLIFGLIGYGVYAIFSRLGTLWINRSGAGQTGVSRQRTLRVAQALGVGGSWLGFGLALFDSGLRFAEHESALGTRPELVALLGLIGAALVLPMPRLAVVPLFVSGATGFMTALGPSWLLVAPLLVASGAMGILAVTRTMMSSRRRLESQLLLAWERRYLLAGAALVLAGTLWLILSPHRSVVWIIITFIPVSIALLAIFVRSKMTALVAVLLMALWIVGGVSKYLVLYAPAVLLMAAHAFRKGESHRVP